MGYSDSPGYFLLTGFIDTEAVSDGSQSHGLSLAQKLAKLHSSPVPIPKGFSRPVFGFPVMTSVGRTPQNNAWSRSWPKFFAENRLRAVCSLVEKNHGSDTDLTSLLDRVVKEVVPRLLGNGHWGGGGRELNLRLSTEICGLVTRLEEESEAKAAWKKSYSMPAPASRTQNTN